METHSDCNLRYRNPHLTAQRISSLLANAVARSNQEYEGCLTRTPWTYCLQWGTKGSPFWSQQQEQSLVLWAASLCSNTGKLIPMLSVLSSCSEICLYKTHKYNNSSFLLHAQFQLNTAKTSYYFVAVLLSSRRPWHVACVKLEVCVRLYCFLLKQHFLVPSSKRLSFLLFCLLHEICSLQSLMLLMLLLFSLP